MAAAATTQDGAAQDCASDDCPCAYVEELEEAEGSDAEGHVPRRFPTTIVVGVGAGTKVKRAERADVLPRFGLAPDFLVGARCTARLLPRDESGRAIPGRPMQLGTVNAILADVQARGVDILEVTVERRWNDPCTFPCRPPGEIDAEWREKLAAPDTAIGIVSGGATLKYTALFQAVSGRGVKAASARRL